MNEENKGFLYAFLSALLFSSKGVLGKFIYTENVEPISLLVLRMSWAAPFFLFIIFKEWGVIEKFPTSKPKLLTAVFGLGFLGYYLASFLDFTGLAYISTGLERVVLFLYPTFVVIWSILFQNYKVSKLLLFAMAMSYFGVFVTYMGDLDYDPQFGILGVSYVLAAAFAFSIYMYHSKKYVTRLGSNLFASLAMMVSFMCLWIHYAFVGTQDLFGFSANVYLATAFMGTFLTVLPSILMMKAVHLLGAEKTSVIAGIGPVMTIILAILFLGENIGMLELLGVGFVIAGGFLLKRA